QGKLVRLENGKIANRDVIDEYVSRRRTITIVVISAIVIGIIGITIAVIFCVRRCQRKRFEKRLRTINQAPSSLAQSADTVQQSSASDRG
ncbi:hypothetical protein PMAYCL1PPCAC_00220, partial [Pristionchus mayeri]